MHRHLQLLSVFRRTFLDDQITLLPIAAHGLQAIRAYSDQVTIGDVTKKIPEAKRPELVPAKYLDTDGLSQNTLSHLRWMLQKDKLGQDIFLIGSPGPSRRRLAMAFLELTRREVEFIALSRDTTESDMKQRREIVKGTAKYFNQSAVRAAVEGRVLILEGIEKAERNVLPVLNNLLENREMHLEDGCFLIPASRYDSLLKDYKKEQLDGWNLIRVDENFRVIALGLPVPKYTGNPLDPPLRSRFQARNVSPPSYQEQIEDLRKACPGFNPAQLSQLLSVAHALSSSESHNLGLPDFPLDNIQLLAPIINNCQFLDSHELLSRLYPYGVMLGRDGREAVKGVLNTFQVEGNSSRTAQVENVEMQENGKVRVGIKSRKKSAKITLPAGCFDQTMSKNYVKTKAHETVIADLIVSHSAGDLCLLGPRGSGKNTVAARVAQLLHLELEPVVLYQDMSSRDLVQQRTTKPTGDTVWQNSPLVNAALQGKLAVLEGIDRVHPSTLSVLHRLVQDRELQLFDGRRLIRHDRFENISLKTGKTEEELAANGVMRIHPGFRILALADTSAQASSNVKWLTGEMLSLFLFHEMPAITRADETLILSSVCVKTLGDKVERVLNLANAIRASQDPALINISSSFSTRQLLRIAKRLTNFPNDSVFECVEKACLARFLPNLARESLHKIMSDHEITKIGDRNLKDISCEGSEDSVLIGKTRVPRYKTDSKSKVPDILFYDVPQHLAALEWLIQDFTLGEHLLLVGNQGVGKNKLADRLLQLLNRPREYIQLHRDTTVQTLTLQPSVRDGVVTYEDSPLVQAVKSGHVLVVDEADKAPTHVTCILKTLVERGEMGLSDGRKILPFNDPRCKIHPNVIPMHPDFRVIVLANRPGFPFLGNDFFATLGDLFSCHAVDNPSTESEIALLKNYGPNVPEAVILKLVDAFGELRKMADNGLVQYPYSTREVVNIVRHLEAFPDEGLPAVVKNVFDFDQYQKSALEALIPVLQKHGIPINASVRDVSLAKEFPMPKLVKYGSWTTGKQNEAEQIEIKSVKFGTERNINSTSNTIDHVQARSAFFTELQSYWQLPLPLHSIVHKLAVSKGEKPSEDLIHVLTLNPIRLYSVRAGSKDVQISQLEVVLPRLPYGIRPQFSMKVLDGDFQGCLAIHEENSNHTSIVNPTTSTVFEVDTKSTSEKVSSKLGISQRQTLRVVDNPFNKNVSFQLRGGRVEVLNLSSATIFGIDLPLKIHSMHCASENSWLIQDTSGAKFLLGKKNSTDPLPSILSRITENLDSNFKLGAITGLNNFDLDDKTLSAVIEKNISAPNRVITTGNSFGLTAVGFPDLNQSDIYLWPRVQNQAHHQGSSVFLQKSGQIVTPVSKSSAPAEINDKLYNLCGYLEIVDIARKTVRYVPLQERTDASSYFMDKELGILAAERSDEGLVVVDRLGTLRIFETGPLQLQRSLDEWMTMVGQENRKLQLTIDSASGKDVSGPKHGKVDPKNDPHVGGNTWAGGSGGRDTAGLGGKGGPYRLSSGHNVHQLSDEEKNDIPEDVKRAAREMGRRAFLQRLKEIQMSEYDHDLYMQYSDPVARQVAALRVILDSVQAKAKERAWTRHQTTGDLDDLKLIEGLTGEKTIYRRRTEKEPEPGTPQMKPKRLRLVVDVSGSMYRFNGYDGRLDRIMEATVMVMEAFEGHETKFVYDIVGHSGETFDHVFVEPGKPPADQKQRLDIIKTMHAHAQFCLSGDHTLPATEHAISTIAQEDCDEAIVVVLSDANLERYGIQPQRLGRALTANPDVGAYAIFIGSLGDQAERLTAVLPAGRSFVCLDLANIPQILQQIFTSSVLKAT